MDRSRAGGSASGMLSLSPATWIFVALQLVDRRAGFDRLYAHVQSQLNQDPLSGHLFLFTNRLRNRVKVLYFDGFGLWVCAKRLERGSFGWPSGEEPVRGLRPEESQVLLHGLRPRRDGIGSAGNFPPLVSLRLYFSLDSIFPLCHTRPMPVASESAVVQGRAMSVSNFAAAPVTFTIVLV